MEHIFFSSSGGCWVVEKTDIAASQDGNSNFLCNFLPISGCCLLLKLKIRYCHGNDWRYLIWFYSIEQMGALPRLLGYHIMDLFAAKGTDTCCLHFCQSINVRRVILSLSFDNLISIWPDLLSLVEHLDQLNIALAVVALQTLITNIELSLYSKFSGLMLHRDELHGGFLWGLSHQLARNNKFVY